MFVDRWNSSSHPHLCVSLLLRNKYLLLNSQELNELSAISMKANIPEVEALVNTDRSLVCDGKKGLLTRILTVMKREPPDSSFRSAVVQMGGSALEMRLLHGCFVVGGCRFWQARAVESFLRGATSYADQMFLLKRGLLEVPACTAHSPSPSQRLWLLSCFSIPSTAHPVLHHRQWLHVSGCPAELLRPARRAHEVQHRCLQTIQQIRQHG